MNWKTVVLGGLAFHALMFVIGFPVGVVVHENLLEPDYKATQEFWRPELRSEPPDMAALMPRWITTGLVTSMALAGIFGAIQGAFAGAGWLRGVKFGVVCGVFVCCLAAGWSGVFDLPDKIWAVWGLESFLYYVPGGALLGWLHGKYFSRSAG